VAAAELLLLPLLLPLLGGDMKDDDISELAKTEFGAGK
jgi:hypothetical protein